MSVGLQTGPNQINLLVQGERFASYRYGAGDLPGFTEIRGGEGRVLTRPDDRTGLALWLGHGQVGGVAFGPQAVGASGEPDLPTPELPVGRIVSETMTARRGAHSVGFQQRCQWLAPNGVVLLTDVRTVRALPGPAEGRVLDVALRLEAPEDRPAILEATQTGLLTICAATPLCPAGSGQMRNSLGDYGPTAMYGRSAAWGACVGVVQGETVGFALLDHPDNPSFPSPWIARDTGLLAPAPFGWRRRELGAGERLVFRYRLLTYRGYVDSNWATERLAEFARTPAS